MILLNRIKYTLAILKLKKYYPQLVVCRHNCLFCKWLYQCKIELCSYFEDNNLK